MICTCFNWMHLHSKHWVWDSGTISKWVTEFSYRSYMWYDTVKAFIQWFRILPTRLLLRNRRRYSFTLQWAVCHWFMHGYTFYRVFVSMILGFKFCFLVLLKAKSNMNLCCMPLHVILWIFNVYFFLLKVCTCTFYDIFSV